MDERFSNDQLCREFLPYWEILLPTDPSKSLPAPLKHNLISCDRNCSELMWIDGNRLEDNASRYDKISLNFVVALLFT